MDTNIVEVYINYLRKKLGRNSTASRGASGGRHSVIRTVRGEGYLLDAPEERDLKAGAGNPPPELTAIFALGGCVADA
jgi:DNA-binding winged helix-turn-helix (wHTH) protein